MGNLWTKMKGSGGGNKETGKEASVKEGSTKEGSSPGAAGGTATVHGKGSSGSPTKGSQKEPTKESAATQQAKESTTEQQEVDIKDVIVKEKIKEEVQEEIVKAVVQETGGLGKQTEARGKDVKAALVKEEVKQEIKEDVAKAAVQEAVAGGKPKDDQLKDAKAAVVKDAVKQEIKEEIVETAIKQEVKKEIVKEQIKEGAKEESRGKTEAAKAAKAKEIIEEKLTEPKLIVVFGATGGQGGSLVRALQADPAFRIRAITRNPESAKAKVLAKIGVEVVAADQDQPESLVKSLAGAYGVFAVTNYWEHMDVEREIRQGKYIADACKRNNVRHVVFSSLESVKDAIGRECHHFDSKAVIEAYMKSIGLPLTTVLYSFYCENLLSMTRPQRGADGVYTLDLPMEGKAMDFVPVAETGECVHQIFKNYDTFLGRAIGLSSQKATIRQCAEILNKHLDGKKFKATENTAKQYGEYAFPGAAALGTMFDFYQTLKLVRDVTLTKSLNPNIPDFEGWVKKNKAALLSAME